MQIRSAHSVVRERWHALTFRLPPGTAEAGSIHVLCANADCDRGYFGPFATAASAARAGALCPGCKEKQGDFFGVLSNNLKGSEDGHVEKRNLREG